MTDPSSTRCLNDRQARAARTLGGGLVSLGKHNATGNKAQINTHLHAMHGN